MLRPAGKPLLDTAHHLFAKFFVFDCARRLRRKSKNGFFVGRRFFQSHALGDHGVEKLRPKNAADLFVHFLANLGRLSLSVTSTPTIFSVGVWCAFTFSVGS